jgi:formate-dependent nitrite reductase membrane component NrfD
MGGFTTFWLIGLYFQLEVLSQVFLWLTSITALVVAVYTAFLFAQAKGRDFWQSPVLVLHMLIHSFMAGSAYFAIIFALIKPSEGFQNFNFTLLMISVIVNLILIAVELSITHPTQDAKRVVSMIVSGRYKKLFWIGSIVTGNILPLFVLTFFPGLAILASILILTGIFLTEKIWVEAPQRISLT